MISEDINRDSGGDQMPDIKLRSWKKTIPIVIGIALMAMMLFSDPYCGNQWLLYYNRSIDGHAVDADTGKPIEDALVIGMWQLSGYVSEGFDGYAKIIVEKTDKSGVFKIPFWINFKPWKIGSRVHELAPKIVIYKPGYELYWSHKLMRSGYPDDTVMTEIEKQDTIIKYSINPTKLKRVNTDEDLWGNHKEFRSQANYPDWYYSRKQLTELFRVLLENVSLLPNSLQSSKKQLKKDVEEDKAFYMEGKR